MRTEVSIDSENPSKLRDILAPSLESDGKVEVRLEASEDQVEINVETEVLGPLRGTTDNVFRLASLANKIYEA